MRWNSHELLCYSDENNGYTPKAFKNIANLNITQLVKVSHIWELDICHQGQMFRSIPLHCSTQKMPYTYYIKKHKQEGVREDQTHVKRDLK